MTTLYISGSPRKRSNTDTLLRRLQNQTGGEFIKLTNFDMQPCGACWACRQNGSCIVDDDMSTVLIPKLLAAQAIVLGSPVFFNNVTAQMKAFIDRTWATRGRLKDKVGAAVVVGRRYGNEGAITTINAFFLKHQMIVANRGVSGIAFGVDEVLQDQESLEATERLGTRILELTAKTAG